MTIGRFIDQLARVVSDPMSNLTGAVILLAMVVLVLLILAVAALVTILPEADDDEETAGDAGGASVPSRRRRTSEPRAALRIRLPSWLSSPRVSRVLTLPVIAVLLVAAALVWGWSSTGDSQRCATCHAMTDAADSWRAGEHKATACISCHEDGVTGLAASAIWRAGDVVADARGARSVTSMTRPVPSYRCLRCHGDVAQGVRRVGRIKVSHKEFLAAGFDCVRCHPQAGHAPARGTSLGVDMSACIACHDGTAARARCDTCHVGDPSAAIRVDRTVFPKVDIPQPPGCRGCHDTSKCTACHGIEMPHPPDFGTPQAHARLGAFAAKQTLCYRCHVPSDCRRCHRGAFTTHGAGWDVKHPSGDPLDGRDYCKGCHLTSNFCGLCHQTSKKT